MHDLKFIRQYPEAFDKKMQLRGLPALSAKILELDEENRTLKTNLQELQNRKNAIAKEIGAARSKGLDAADLMAEGNKVKEEIPALETQQKSVDEKLFEILSSTPNLVEDSVPKGEDENHNETVRTWGVPKEFDFPALPHEEIGTNLAMFDPERAAKISGSRFVFLYHHLARLERALGAFMLDVHTTEHGYMEVSAPTLVTAKTLFGTGQLPKFEDDQFKTTNGMYLTATSEISLTNKVADEILSEKELPMRLTALTPCYRQEAGSAGRDTRGMIRLHQFYKVELVSIVTPEESTQELERKTNCAEEILKRLDLPYRVQNLCSGDIGFCAQKTYDLEVWLPGQKAYREISSCSNTGAFQARRMNARFRDYDQQVHHVHTLNGSGLPLGRTLVAVMENYQNADGSITIPSVLRPYMNGLEKIEKVSHE